MQSQMPKMVRFAAMPQQKLIGHTEQSQHISFILENRKEQSPAQMWLRCRCSNLGLQLLKGTKTSVVESEESCIIDTINRNFSWTQLSFNFVPAMQILQKLFELAGHATYVE